MKIFVVKSYTFESICGVYSSYKNAVQYCVSDIDWGAPYEISEFVIDGELVKFWRGYVADLMKHSGE